MKKIDLNVNRNFFIKKNKPNKNRLIQNPKKLFRKKSVEKNNKYNNYTSLYLNQESQQYNNTLNKFYFKKEINQNCRTDKISSPIRTFTKLNLYKKKLNSSRPQSNFMKRLPLLMNNNNNNNSSMLFNPISYKSIEEEKMNQEKVQLNKMIKNLNKELNLLKKENLAKDIMLNNKENEVNDIIYSVNLTEEEEKDLNSKIMNYQNMDFLEENKTSAYQHTSSNLLILKIKKEIERFNEELIETTKKINKYRSSLIFTKLKEINAENNLYEIQMKKIASLLNNALNIKEANEKKIQEMLSFEYNINIQNSIILELENKKNLFDNEEITLKNNIKDIEKNLDFARKQIDKNTKEIQLLKQKNNNLLNDKLLNSKISIEDMEENQPIKNYFISKISNLKNDIKFLKSKDIHDQTIIAQLNEQKNNMIETIKQLKNIDIPSKLSSMKNNIILNEPDRDDEIKKDEIKNINANVSDVEEIEKLKKIYSEHKIYEKKWEIKYKQFNDKFETLYSMFQEQNSPKNQEININNSEENQTDGNNQNEIEFGIDKSNPFYTEDDDNNPEINLKFNSTQYNQFTYILFKNFESKGIVMNESFNKIINPFVEFANEQKLKIVQYPSSQFEIIVEGFTKIILGVLNMDNKYNHILTKIFLSALLINSKCDIQKMVEYIAILFSYTRDYKTDEEKYLKKLISLYTKELIEINNCINNYIENNNEDNDDHNKKYFPLIKLKELIEENQINLKDKYVEFLFYYLKKFDDKEAKLDDLKYALLNDIIEKLDDEKGKSSIVDDDKKSNTEPNKRKNVNDILKNNYKDNYMNNEINEKINKEENSQEITLEEYQNYINSSLKAIKSALNEKDIKFKDFIEDKIKIMKYEDKDDMQYISINDLNNKLKSIGVILSEMEFSCLYNKYGIENDLGVINIKLLEEGINSYEI